jgi:hypothetical protein
MNFSPTSKVGAVQGTERPAGMESAEAMVVIRRPAISGAKVRDAVR